ncbi:MAG TPA: DUF2087 domain-containing protein [Actinomycetota bacterium]|nr:DUF2087 domain-containing protein [Actinomycetota bacterium]
MKETRPEVSAAVSCGSSAHTIVWAEGRLLAPDHDETAELTALALGADAPYCVLVAATWSRGGVDLVSLLGTDEENPRRQGLRRSVPQGARSTAPQVVTWANPPGPGTSSGRRQPAPHGLVTWSHHHGRRLEELEALWALPEPIRHRIVLDEVLRRAPHHETLVGMLTSLEQGTSRLTKEIFREASRVLRKDGAILGTEDGGDDGLVLARFFEGDRLREIPANLTKRRLVLRRLAKGFRTGRAYSEAEVNRILNQFHPDHAALRRYLIDEGLLHRSGGIYSVPIGRPDPWDEAIPARD